jgi:glyoxylase-like metal-dependent hydrolase (beta-lactamase superfamily II)
MESAPPETKVFRGAPFGHLPTPGPRVPASMAEGPLMLMIPAGNPSQWTGPTGNNTYLLTGSTPTLVDAGIGEPGHLAALESALAGRPLAQLLATHGHTDHTAGIPHLRARWPELVVRNSGGDACREGEVIPAGDTVLRALHTPGHAPDHFCFLDEGSRDVYCGDLARLGGTIVIPASSGGDLAAYLASLHRIRALAPARLLPGHGPVITDPVALLDEYIAHRLDRERQILRALADGCRTLDAITQRVYGLVPAVITRAARDSAHAHLIKLAAEGRVVETGDDWTAV